MSKMTKIDRKAIFAIIAAVIMIGGTWLLYHAFAPQLIETMYKGQSYAFLNKIMAARKVLPIEHYFGQGEKYLRIVLAFEIALAVLSIGSLLPLRLGQRIWQIIRDFFNVTAHPISLAIFRIALFGLNLVLVLDWATGKPDASSTVWWAGFPKALLVPPPGISWLVALLPINPSAAAIICWLAVFFTFTAFIGFYSRTSAALSALLCIYVMGVPQFWGKVHHYHHLVWFATMLALSPCGDMLSVDALFNARKRADQGDIEPPSPARAYAVPMRFVWLLIGIVYFFPGYWKVMESGLAWAFSDNLKMTFYNKWFELNNWRPFFYPFFQVDKYDWLLRPMAFFTLVTEIGFIFALFHKWTRCIWMTMAQGFHFGTLILMRIPFLDLQICYVVFFAWEKIFAWLGQRLYKQPMFVLYDGNCQRCRRTIAAVRTMDVFGQVIYVNALDRAALQANGLDWLPEQALVTDMHAVIGKEKYVGYAAYQALAKRVLGLWPLAPFLAIPAVAQLGQRVYRGVADSRTCDVKKAVAPTVKTIVRPFDLRLTTAIGSFLVVSNILLGFAHVHTWPISMYPTFQGIQNDLLQTMSIEVITKDGQTVWVNNDEIMQNFSADRFFPIVTNILNEGKASEDHERRDRKLLAIWQVLQQSNPALTPLQVARLDLYMDTYTVVPERAKENPLDHKLLAEVDAEKLK